MGHRLQQATIAVAAFLDMLGGMAIMVLALCPGNGKWNDVYVAENPDAIKGVKFKYRCPQCRTEHELVVSGYEKTKNIPPKSVLAVRSL